MLIDRATIFVRSGKGGDGCISFRRERYVPKGGPDGGDGGRGGDVVLVGDSSLSTLLPLTPRPHYRATNGRQGMGKSMHGADGEDCLVHIPLGTLVYDKISGELIVDIDRDGQRFIVAPGGRGGLGNEHFKSSTNQTPREATPGQPGVERTLRLELKLIADVGLIGKPNAGKSTLLRSVSRANPKVASYPFTTLTPHLGIAQLPAARRSGDRKGGERRLVIADIPGLIDGAAEGAGLGHDFLRHVERTRLLVHVLDVQPMDGSDPRANYEAIRRELFEYSPAMAEKPEIVALNKIDLVPEPERDEVIGHLLRQLDLPPDEPPVRTSGATGDGLADLLETCWQRLDKSPAGWTAGEQRSDTA